MEEISFEYHTRIHTGENYIYASIVINLSYRTMLLNSISGFKPGRNHINVIRFSHI